MKKSVYFLLSIFIITSSCKKLNELTQFNIDYTAEITIPSSAGANLPFNVYSPNIVTNSESTFESNDTRKDHIEHISLTRLNLTLKSPSNSSLDFLKSIEIYIQADGMDEQRIAWNEDIPNTVGKTLSLEVSGSDVKEFIKKDEFSLRVKTETRKVVTSDHKIDVDFSLFVDAKVFK